MQHACDISYKIITIMRILSCIQSFIHSFQFNRLLPHDVKFNRQPRLAVGRIGDFAVYCSNCQEIISVGG